MRQFDKANGQDLFDDKLIAKQDEEQKQQEDEDRELNKQNLTNKKESIRESISTDKQFLNDIVEDE